LGRSWRSSIILACWFVSEMVKNGYKSFFCSFKLTMDFFDERILAALRDGKPRGFTALLGEVGFSPNTLRQRLERLMSQGLIVREKTVSKSFGRPRFAYHVPSRTTKQVTVALQDPNVELAAPPFSRLRHVCRFEKGGYCKETRKNCAPQICPQIRK